MPSFSKLADFTATKEMTIFSLQMTFQVCFKESCFVSWQVADHFVNKFS